VVARLLRAGARPDARAAMPFLGPGRQLSAADAPTWARLEMLRMGALALPLAAAAV
jgi:hypothetical protein